MWATSTRRPCPALKGYRIPAKPILSTDRLEPGMYVLIKAVISGILIAAASEAGRRSAWLGALIVSLPLVSSQAMVRIGPKFGLRL